MNWGAHMTIAQLRSPRDSEHVTLDADRMMQASSVAARYDISVRTLDRWLQKPHLDFPKPVMLMHDVAGRVSSRFWRLGDLIAWERLQAVQRARAS
jgi:predicted DNA-binding transcriptional regulator AlpA